MRKYIRSLFKRGNVCVFGVRGSGKDILFGNIIARDKRPYISNCNYGYKHIPFNYNDFKVGNSYSNFITGNINYYEFAYENVDLYLSDCGIYFPSQYHSILDKKFEDMPTFQALSRQLGNCNTHTNAQDLGRVWDKIREQSDIYILCCKCKIILGVVFMRVIVYDKYNSALNKVKPCRISCPLFASKQTKMQCKMYLDDFYNKNGNIKAYNLVFINKSKHDTRLFKDILKGGK